MMSKFYIHSNKEDSHSQFIREVINPTEKQLQNARYAGYEVKFEGFWDEEGQFMVTHVNGTKLEKPTAI